MSGSCKATHNNLAALLLHAPGRSHKDCGFPPVLNKRPQSLTENRLFCDLPVRRFRAQNVCPLRLTRRGSQTRRNALVSRHPPNAHTNTGFPAFHRLIFGGDGLLAPDRSWKDGRNLAKVPQLHIEWPQSSPRFAIPLQYKLRVSDLSG